MFIAKIPKIPYSRKAKLVTNLRIDITSLVQQQMTKFLVLGYGFSGRSANPKKTFSDCKGLRDVAMATKFWPK